MKKFFTAVALMGAISLTGCAQKDGLDYTVRNMFGDDPKTVYVTEKYTDGTERDYTVTFENAKDARAYMKTGK